jgi:hypothetical protein
MPSLLTHQWFSQRIIDHYQTQFPFLKDHAAMVYLGAQGPDPFFFYGHAPFHSRKETEAMNAFGGFLHNHALSLTLGKLLNAFHAQLREEAVVAYILGALTHYALDSTVHPYVFYRSGFDEKGQLTGRYGYDHARLEVAMDVALIQEKALDKKQYQPSVTLSFKQEEVEKVSRLYAKAYPEQLTEHVFFNACEDMKASYQFLYHAGPLRKTLIRVLSGKYGLARALIHPRSIASPWQTTVLNATQVPWQFPETGKEVSLTLMELVTQAEEKMAHLIPMVTNAPTHEELNAWTVDYDGKTVGSQQRYFQSYFR